MSTDKTSWHRLANDNADAWQARAEAAEATVKRVEALIDPWKSNPLADTFGSFERRLRAALTEPVPAPEIEAKS